MNWSARHCGGAGVTTLHSTGAFIKHLLCPALCEKHEVICSFVDAICVLKFLYVNATEGSILSTEIL